MLSYVFLTSHLQQWPIPYGAKLRNIISVLNYLPHIYDIQISDFYNVLQTQKRPITFTGEIHFLKNKNTNTQFVIEQFSGKKKINTAYAKVGILSIHTHIIYDNSNK